MKKSNQSKSREHINNQKSTAIEYHSRKIPHLNNLGMRQPLKTYSHLRTEHFPVSHHQLNYTPSHQPYNKEVSDYSRIRGRGEGIVQQGIVLLKERLKNVKEYYEMMINEEKNKNKEKSQVIIGLIDELQTTHTEKILTIRKMIEENEGQKRDVGLVDDKMNEIKGNIEELINQSNDLKVINDNLEKKIEQKRKDSKQKEKQLQELSQQVLESRGQLQKFQINNLKNNKVNRQILEIFNSASTLSTN